MDQSFVPGPDWGFELTLFVLALLVFGAAVLVIFL